MWVGQTSTQCCCRADLCACCSDLCDLLLLLLLLHITEFDDECAFLLCERKKIKKSFFEV